MKTFFQVTSMFTIVFITGMMSIVTFTNNDNLRRPWTDESLLELIYWQTVLLGVFLLCKLGVYLCNTYNLELTKKRR